MGYGKINNVQNQAILTQTIIFKDGYNYFSFYVDINAQHIPGKPCREITFDDIFSPYEQSIIQITEHKQGLPARIWYGGTGSAGNTYSTFKKWDKTQGYRLKADTVDPFSVTVKGPRLSPRKNVVSLSASASIYTECVWDGPTASSTSCVNFDDAFQPDPDNFPTVGFGINVNDPSGYTGWAIIPYFGAPNKDVPTLLSDFADDIDILKDEEGRFWWPSIPINTIGDFAPGEGYQIKVSGDIDITYPGI